jgi:hypothetical protein
MNTISFVKPVTTLFELSIEDFVKDHLECAKFYSNPFFNADKCLDLYIDVNGNLQRVAYIKLTDAEWNSLDRTNQDQKEFILANADRVID